MVTSAPLTVDRSQAQVEGLMGQGAVFSNVEDAIDIAPLSTQHKAALWLLAWSLRDSALQRRDARLMLAAVAADRREAGGEGDLTGRPCAAVPALRIVGGVPRSTALGSPPSSPGGRARAPGQT